MRKQTDRRTPIEKRVDRYVDEMIAATGRRDPRRRTRLVKDIEYSLQVIDGYAERLTQAMRYDIYGVDSDYMIAVGKVREAALTLQQYGLRVELPREIIDPDIIVAECAMAFIDSLSVLDALHKAASEAFVVEVLARRLKIDLHRQVRELIKRYLDRTITEEELDRIALEEGYLQHYLKSL